MKITKERKAERESLVYSLFFVKKMKIKDIAKLLKIHRNTVSKYIKKHLT
ncbi:hypothetical protein DLH72_04965 [Candidatus Gracilibacteria bacterium]|nr:MAG: hypothetical protein DLH72_04965 [Candidatus Gracilibacteria bacterium]